VILMRFHLICVWIFGFNNDYVYLFFKVMCSYLFKIIIVHGIHHWNYLRFNVFFFLMASILIYPWMCFHIGPKPHWASVPSPLTINNIIFSFNKLLLSFFLFLFLRSVFCSLLHMDGHGSINCMWVLHI